MNYYFTYSDKNYVHIAERLFKSLQEYSSYKIIYYTINFDYDNNFDNVIPIRYDFDHTKFLPYELNEEQMQHWTKKYMLYLKSNLCLEILKTKENNNYCCIDSDMILIKDADFLFDKINSDINFPILPLNCHEYMIIDGRGCPFSNDSGFNIKKCLESDLMEFLNIPIEKRNPFYKQCNLLLFNKNSLKLFEEWYEICYRPEIIKNKYLAALNEESVINCLLWKYNYNINFDHIHINIPLDEVDTLVSAFKNPSENVCFIKIFCRIPQKQKINDIIFLHGRPNTENYKILEKEIIYKNKKDNSIKQLQVSKKILLIINPHLSTGGCPEYLYQFILNNKYQYEAIKVIEFSNFSNEYVIQKNKIKNLIGEQNVVCLGDFWEDDITFESKKYKLLDIINEFSPDIVWLNEFPECFEYKLPPEQLMKKIYSVNRTYKIIETTHNNNFDFNNKVFIPDEFMFCSELHLEKSKNINIKKYVWEIPIQNNQRPNREDTLRSLNLDPEFLHVLNVGIFNKNKNQKYIFDLAENLKSYKIQFHFIGNFCFLNECGIEENQLSLNNCKIWGERSDVDLFMSCMDIFLFPSHNELNPLSVKEALSWNMDVVCKKCDNYTKKYSNISNFYLLENINIFNFIINKLQNIKHVELKNNNKIFPSNIKENDCVNINVVNESGSLGDAIAWVPVVNEYAKKHKIKVNFFTPHRDLFINSYPMINFFDYSQKPKDNNISIGCFDEKIWRPSSLQKIACDILKIDNKEIRCKVDIDKNKKSNFTKKYVCIATQSTLQCKYWNNKTGWIQVVDYLNQLGYDVVCIDQHYSFGAMPDNMNNIPYNAIDKTGDISLRERINDLYHCEFFIGLGSGLSWLAWACEKPVIMISGFSDPKSEFTTPYRVHTKNVCNSCWNDVSLFFDKSNWLWCPRNKNFECSREITFKMVQDKIDLCISDLKIKNNKFDWFKIEAAHILVDVNSERESKSINCMKNIEPEIKYIQCINERYTGDDWKKQVPLSGWRRHNAGHYGAFQSFKKAILENLKKNIDGLLIFECDCVLDVPKEQFIRKVNEAMIFCKLYNLPYFSFGPRVVNNYLESQEIYNDPDFPDFIITNQIILAHCILLNGSYRDYIFERLNESWDSPDLWFNEVFVKYSMGIVKKELAYQTQGMSMLDNYIKGELR